MIMIKKRVVAFLLCLVLLIGAAPLCFAKTASVSGINVSGFTINNFDSETKYYLCYPSSFSGISVNSVTLTSGKPYKIEISVEQYCGKTYSASLGQKLDLGYGRARITVRVYVNSKDYATYLFTLKDPGQANYYYAFPIGSTKIYSSRSTSSAVVKTVSKSTANSAMLYCTGTSGEWTRVQCCNASNLGAVGWIQSKYLSRGYQPTDRPNTFADKIKVLQKAHPKWTFEYVSMGTFLSDYAKTVQSQIKSANGKTENLTTIANAMNPVNYLTEKKIFAFLDLSKSSGYTQKGLESMWVEKSGAIINRAQAVEAIAAASNSTSLNAYFIASRAAIESGYGTSKLSKGQVSGCEGYYNFYGIGAYDSNPANGAVYAKGRGWNTPFRAIVEGANWIKDQYIDRGQNTSYFLRFFTLRAHSYMTDLAAPSSEADKLYQGYSAAGALNTALHFVIPVYDGAMYADVSPKEWYYDYVNSATELGLFDGVGGGKFEPDGSLTRAQFVTVLSRIAGADVSKYNTAKFKDVSSKAWYYHAVAWASATGITSGVSATSFAPEDALSREMLCTMLTRFAKTINKPLPAGDISQYKDAASISKWARAGVGACSKAGIVAGVGGGRFDPSATATRAQGAKILSIYYTDFMK